MKATFGGGCFWGVEEAFRTLEGVTKTVVGFMGGKTKNPTYVETTTGKTGHAEVVQLEYDPKQISYRNLLKKFFEIHDPTEVDRQGPDVGNQYRSVIFYHNNKQKEEAERYKEELQKSGKYFPKTTATQIEPAKEFYKAEKYHQKYLQKRNRKIC